MVISHASYNDNLRIFLHFQTDHDRKVNCSYSGIASDIIYINIHFKNELQYAVL